MTALIINTGELSSQEFALMFFYSTHGFSFNFPVTDNPSTESNRKEKDVLVHILLNSTNTKETMASFSKELGQR